jgi:hypothetical protein
MRRLAIYLAAVCTVAPTVAFAGTSYFHSGQQCQWYTPDATLSYSNKGTVNNKTGAGVRGNWCPVGYSVVPGTAVTIDKVDVNYYDASANDSFSCTVMETNWDGSLQWSSTVSSCDTWGGCGYNTQPSSTGQGTLEFNNPISVGNQYPINVNIQCLIPVQSTLYSYWVTIN